MKNTVQIYAFYVLQHNILLALFNI